MNTKKCYPGYIVRNIIEQYVEETEMKHILLTDPFLWDEANRFQYEDISIAWLMAVPISESELSYATKHGGKALEELFEEKDIDIFNLYREPVI